MKVVLNLYVVLVRLAMLALLHVWAYGAWGWLGVGVVAFALVSRAGVCLWLRDRASLWGDEYEDEPEDEELTP